MICTAHIVCPSLCSLQGAAGLDGGPSFNAAAMPRSAGAIVDVSLLVSNPYYVCWAGHHRVPGIIAAVSLPAFVAGLPALTLWWLYRDPWVRAAAAAAVAAVDHGTSAQKLSDRRRGSSVGDVFVGVDNPMAIERGRRGVPPSPTDSALVAPPAAPPVPDPLLGVFFYDYKPSSWHTKHADLGLLLILSLFRALLPRPATLGLLIGKTVVLCAAIFSACVHVLWTRPYLEADAWMGWVRHPILIQLH